MGLKASLSGYFASRSLEFWKPDSRKVSNDLPFYIKFNFRMFVVSFFIRFLIIILHFMATFVINCLSSTNGPDQNNFPKISN